MSTPYQNNQYNPIDIIKKQTKIKFDILHLHALGEKISQELREGKHTLPKSMAWDLGFKQAQVHGHLKNLKQADALIDSELEALQKSLQFQQRLYSTQNDDQWEHTEQFKNLTKKIDQLLETYKPENYNNKTLEQSNVNMNKERFILKTIWI